MTNRYSLGSVVGAGVIAGLVFAVFEMVAAALMMGSAPRSCRSG